MVLKIGRSRHTDATEALSSSDFNGLLRHEKSRLAANSMATGINAAANVALLAGTWLSISAGDTRQAAFAGAASAMDSLVSVMLIRRGERIRYIVKSLKSNSRIRSLIVSDAVALIDREPRHINRAEIYSAAAVHAAEVDDMKLASELLKFAAQEYANGAAALRSRPNGSRAAQAHITHLVEDFLAHVSKQFASTAVQVEGARSPRKARVAIRKLRSSIIAPGRDDMQRASLHLMDVDLAELEHIMESGRSAAARTLSTAQQEAKQKLAVVRT